jgi:hypothetical protein
MLGNKPVLTKDQEDEAIEFMRGIVRTKYTLKQVDKGTTSKVDVGPISGSGAKFDKDIAEYSGKQNEQAQMGQYLSYFYNGNLQQKQAIASKFRNRGNIDDILITDKDMTVLYKNGDVKTQSFYTPNGQPLGPDNFVLSAYDLFYQDKGFDENTLLRNVRNTVKNPTVNYIREVEENELLKFSNINDWWTQSLLNASKGQKKKVRERVIGGLSEPAQGGGSQGSSNLNASNRKPK